jgi:4-hydroxy-3-methylbut-2-enyl diphosphate reductase
MIKIQIDDTSGFCSGVIRAVGMAEDALEQSGKLYCLGNIVHNPVELARLTEMGMEIIDYDQYRKLKDTTVLIRAHGEPPHVFTTAKENNIKLLNGTCPIVNRLQDKVRTALEKVENDKGTIIIYGRKEHPEVVALVGIASGKAIVVRNLDELEEITFTTPVYLFAQTTNSREKYVELAEEIKQRIITDGGDPESMLYFHRTVCGEVASRLPDIERFAQQYDLILFVSGKESSNGRMLYKACKEINPNTWFITEIEDMDPVPVKDAESIGISGATSTPPWFLEEVRDTAIGIIEKI